MRRKLLVVGVAMIALSFGAWVTLRGPYHQWRWVACRQTADRLRAGENSLSDEFLSLLRGNPKTYNEYFEAATRHEDALIKMNYLTRKEFRLRNPVTSRKTMERFSELALKRFPNTREWSCIFSPNGESVVITTKPKRIAEWEKFIRDYDAVKKSKAHRKCKGRRNWLEAIQPVRW